MAHTCIRPERGRRGRISACSRGCGNLREHASAFDESGAREGTSFFVPWRAHCRPQNMLRDRPLSAPWAPRIAAIAVLSLAWIACSDGTYAKSDEGADAGPHAATDDASEPAEGDAGKSANLDAGSKDGAVSDGGQKDSTPGSLSDASTSYLVFITHDALRGAFALGAASTFAEPDAICQREGSVANPGKKFVAFLTAATQGSGAARLGSTPGPWKLANGTLIFPDITSIEQPPVAPINPKGIGGQDVWTGGLGKTGYGDCNGWTSYDNKDIGAVGDPRTSAPWRYSYNAGCYSLRTFYCFEVNP